MQCLVKSLLTEPLYLLTLRLFDIIFSNNTHRLLVVSTTSCRLRAQNSGRPERSKSVQDEELTGQTSNVAFMFAFMFTFKIRKKKLKHLVYGEKLPRLTELTAGRLSPEFIQTLISFKHSMIDSTIDVQHNFVSLSETPILAPFSFSITTLVHAL